MDLFSFTLSLFILLVISAYYLLQRQISQRRHTETLLEQQTQRERLVKQITHHIRESLNLEEVLNTTVAEVRQFLQTDRVLIYRIWDDGTGSPIKEAVLPDYPAILGEIFPEEVFPREYHQAYIEGKIRAITNIEQEDVESCLREFVQQFKVKAKLVVPIIQEIRENSNLSAVSPCQPYLWGLLIAHHCRQPRLWQPLEIDLMKQLATQVAIAIQQSELYTQLQQLNRELEDRVQQRTQELAITNVALREEIVERQRTEAALRHTNQTLQSLISASPRAIFTLDLEDRVKLWNPAAEKMFGWQEEEVREKPNPIISDDNCPDYQKLREKVMQGLTPPSLEIRRYKKDGSSLEIVFSAAPLRDSEGKIEGMVVVVADITEQKRQAEQIRLLQSVVVNTHDAVLITEAEPIDEPGPRIIYVNEAFTRITGYSPQEVIGKTPRILQGAKTDRKQLDKVRIALSQWQPVAIEIINYRKDGSEFWVELSIVPVANKQGIYTHWISVQRDITERKKTEKALRRSEERFRSLIENALDIIIILGVDGTINYQSPSVEKVLGYKSLELMGKNLFNYIHPDDLSHTTSGLLKSLEIPQSSPPLEFRFRQKNGDWRILEAISQKFIDETSEAKIVVNSRDITERKRLDEVRLALEREKELNTMKTRFFSMVSHEFRTPLSTALAAVQLLETSPNAWQIPEKRTRNLQRIQNSVKNMVQLLDDILTINRAETGKLDFNPKPLNLKNFCRQFVEEMLLSTGTSHSLNFICQEEAIQGNFDEKLLRSIFANILSNAIKYSPNNSHIHVELRRNNNQARIQIRDRGMGISPDDQKQLFQPFYRGKNVLHLQGTGLGLVVVKKCVDLHGGSISIKSELGKGTIVTILLPLD